MPSSPTVPPRSATLWRYMSLEKFIGMLHHQGLFFCYPGKMDDPFEGSLPAPTIMRLRYKNVAELIERSTKKGNIVSCWHEVDHESEAMWKLHAGRGAGIAVKTNFESLMEALTPGWIDEHHYTFMAGRVSYVDYDTEDIPVLNGMPLFYKRKSFSHEREVRIASFDNESESRHGATYHVNLDKLIHEIVISPLVEDWVHQIVVETTRRFDESLAERVRKSDLVRPPALELFSGG